MTLQRIREICLALPDATEQIQWGKDLVFKIKGKMFCVACTEPVVPPKVSLSFKCDDATFAELVERNGVIPAPYMAQHKWVAPEQFDTLGAAELEKLIVRAYEIVRAKFKAPKRKKPAKKVAAKKAAAKKPASKRAGPSTRPKSAKRSSGSLRAGKKSAKKPARRSGRAPARRGR
jgi:predicted DNA-binding protein (MmcQ/YjbR family)